MTNDDYIGVAILFLIVLFTSGGYLWVCNMVENIIKNGKPYEDDQ